MNSVRDTIVVEPGLIIYTVCWVRRDVDQVFTASVLIRIGNAKLNSHIQEGGGGKFLDRTILGGVGLFWLKIFSHSYRNVDSKFDKKNIGVLSLAYCSGTSYFRKGLL